MESIMLELITSVVGTVLAHWITCWIDRRRAYRGGYWI